MAFGYVKRFNNIYGWGFVADEHGQDHFVHYSFIKGAGYKTLEEGDRVEFVSVTSPRGLQAQDVVKVSIREPEPPPAPTKVRLRQNPFTPQDPVTDPAKFAGRGEAIRNAIDALFNHKNILVSGDRGIGKSSVAYQLLFMTKGQRELIDRFEIETGSFSFNYLTADHRCLPIHHLEEVISGLASSLSKSVQRFARDKQARPSSQVGLLSMPESGRGLPPEFVDGFVSLIEDAAKTGEGVGLNGVCLLLDEIDCLIDEVPLAPFFKAVMEKLRLDGFRNVSFIAAGVTGTITNLIGQHPSAARLFENIEVRRMESKDLAGIIDAALTGTGAKIDVRTRDRIISLSDGFPSPVHLLGYHAFRYDQDDMLDLTDLRRAQDYIVRELKRQEFAELYERAGEGRIILEVMAASEEAEISAQDVANRAGLSGHQGLMKVEGVITGSLMKREIVVSGSRRGHYKIREPLFKIYLRWILNLG